MMISMSRAHVTWTTIRIMVITMSLGACQIPNGVGFHVMEKNLILSILNKNIMKHHTMKHWNILPKMPYLGIPLASWKYVFLPLDVYMLLRLRQPGRYLILFNILPVFLSIVVIWIISVFPVQFLVTSTIFSHVFL